MAATRAKTIFSLATVSLAAAAESLLAPRLFPQYLDGSLRSHFAAAAMVFAFNYTLYALFWAVVYPSFLSPLRHLPGPRNYLSISYRALLENRKFPGDLFVELEHQYPDEEILALDWFQEKVLITKPRLLSQLLVHQSYDFPKPTRARTFLRQALGDGLVTVEGNQHKFMRKNTMPAFAFRHIKDLYPMMWTKVVMLADVLRDEIKADAKDGSASATIELSTWASRVTMDIIGVAGMGRNFQMLKKIEDPLLTIFAELLEPTRDNLVFAALSIIFGMDVVGKLGLKRHKRFMELTKELDNQCFPMIHDKRKAIAEKADDHFDVLSLLIKSGNFSDRELTDQLVTFLAAGHETTASSLSWASYLLAQHPDIQERMRKEVAESMSTVDETTDLPGILERLPILNGVINETLRLYPTVPMTLRQATRDTRLGDYAIPKDAVVVLSMWQMQRSTEVWGPDAAEFKPERWVNKDDGRPNQTGGAASNYQFITFLHGPRSCIGQAFAKAELRCLMASLVSSFRWDLDMDPDLVVPKGAITIKPGNGLYLKMTPLDSGASE